MISGLGRGNPLQAKFSKYARLVLMKHHNIQKSGKIMRKTKHIFSHLFYLLLEEKSLDRLDDFYWQFNTQVKWKYKKGHFLLLLNRYPNPTKI